MRIKPIIQNGGLFLLAATAVYGTREYVNDYNNAQKIKSEISEYKPIPTDPYDIKIKLMDAERKEPFLNKTAYWEVEAQKIRESTNARIKNYENIHTPISTAKSVKEMLIKDLANSFELRIFLINDSVARDEHLRANPSLKLLHTKKYTLDDTFPTNILESLKDSINNDTNWIPKKKNGYTIHKEQKKIKIGNKEKIRTVRVKEPKLKPVYKDIQGFFEPEIKEENGVMYLICNFYGHENK